MYRASRSVPRGYEYLSARFSTRKRHKADIVQDLPPAPYLHQAKNYSNVSPLRSKQKLIEARTFKSPLGEHNRTLTLNPSKAESVFGNICNISHTFKLNNKKLLKQCKENLKKLKTFKKSVSL